MEKSLKINVRHAITARNVYKIKYHFKWIVTKTHPPAGAELKKGSRVKVFVKLVEFTMPKAAHGKK